MHWSATFATIRRSCELITAHAITPESETDWMQTPHDRRASRHEARLPSTQVMYLPRCRPTQNPLPLFLRGGCAACPLIKSISCVFPTTLQFQQSCCRCFRGVHDECTVEHEQALHGHHGFGPLACRGMRIGKIECVEQFREIVPNHRQINAAAGEISTSAILVGPHGRCLISQVVDRRVECGAVQLASDGKHRVAQSFRF